MKQSCETWLKSQFGDDRETIEAVYAEYVETMAGLRKELAGVRSSGDTAALDRVLHTIKGTAAMAGDTELSEKAQAARGSAESVQLDAIDRLMSDISCANMHNSKF